VVNRPPQYWQRFLSRKKMFLRPRQAIEMQQEDDPGDADPEGGSGQEFVVRLRRNVFPIFPIVGGVVGRDGADLSLVEQAEGPSDGSDLDGLEEPVEDEDAAVDHDLTLRAPLGYSQLR
jgi:hypothetical protein